MDFSSGGDANAYKDVQEPIHILSLRTTIPEMTVRAVELERGEKQSAVLYVTSEVMREDTHRLTLMEDHNLVLNKCARDGGNVNLSGIFLADNSFHSIT